ncbi:MAG TPA: hypothetical protein VFV47_00140 [Hyphomicrobiaceae bacterium]|nr:hypothetical protein [Hyphomicrobiaceae bacterium]
MIGKTIDYLIAHAALVVPAVLVALLVLSTSARNVGRFVLRFLARPLLLLAVVALVYDGTRALAGSGLVITSVIDHWQTMAPASLEAAKGAIARVHPVVWDAALLRLLKLPAWLVVGVFGFLLAWLGRKRQRATIFMNQG